MSQTLESLALVDDSSLGLSLDVPCCVPEVYNILLPEIYLENESIDLIKSLKG